MKIGARKSVLDRAIACRFICPDAVNSILVRQPLIVAVSQIALKHSTRPKQEQHRSYRASPTWFRTTVSTQKRVEAGRGGKWRESTGGFWHAPTSVQGGRHLTQPTVTSRERVREGPAAFQCLGAALARRPTPPADPSHWSRHT